MVHEMPPACSASRAYPDIEALEAHRFRKPDVGQLFKYLACLDTVSFWGYLDALQHRPKTYDVEKEWASMYHAIGNALIAL